MSAINLRSVKLEFSELNYRPDICHPNLINELKKILETTGRYTDSPKSYGSNIQLFHILNLKRDCRELYYIKISR